MKNSWLVKASRETLKLIIDEDH